MGSQIFVNINSRSQLPDLREDKPIPLYKIISKFVNKDLMRVSLPCIMNEPMSGPQRFAENMWALDYLFTKAANDINSVKRICYASIAVAVLLHTTRVRSRKPFNPMLGETYELVTDKFRFLAEKVQHTPS